MKKIILIAAILVGALTNGQAQVINKNYAKRIGQAVKEGTRTLRKLSYKTPNHQVNIRFGTSTQPQKWD